MSDEPVQTVASVWDALEETSEVATDKPAESLGPVALRAGDPSWTRARTRPA